MTRTSWGFMSQTYHTQPLAIYQLQVRFSHSSAHEVFLICYSVILNIYSSVTPIVGAKVYPVT
jgi:hypothetical protein